MTSAARSASGFLGLATGHGKRFPTVLRHPTGYPATHEPMQIEASYRCALLALTHIAAALLLAGWLASPASAEEVYRLPTPNAESGSPGLGSGLRIFTEPYVGSDFRADLVPLFLFEGKYLFARGTEGGVHIVNKDAFSIDALVRYRFNKLDPKDIDDPLIEGLRKRRQTLDGGLAIESRNDWGDVRLEWLTDLQGRHKGQEARATYAYRMTRGNWALRPWVTLSWQDSKLTDYYYGVSDEEATFERAAYSPGSAFNLALGINSSLQITDHFFVYGNVGFSALDQGIEDSPIVDSGLGASAFVGAGYLFAPLRRSSRVADDRQGEWSWRVNAGYAAEQNVFPYIMAGLVQGSEDADVGIAGFTVGKLVMAGPRVDFYAKLSLNRHFEDNLQDDFWSTAAYMMGIGKGYLPWSDKLAFRWGFGFGASYAAEVPIIEQIKQENTDEETSRLLAYMEFTFDVPIDGLIKSKLTRNCFAGMTVVHRSGIFSYSDMLGNVAGGSDYITFHLECLR